MPCTSDVISEASCATQITHNTDAVVAALSFCGQLERYRHMTTAPGAAAASSGEAAAQAPHQDFADPKQPSTLAERAKQAFANHNLPVTKKLSVPATSIHLCCPGQPPCSCTPRVPAFSLQCLHSMVGHRHARMRHRTCVCVCVCMAQILGASCRVPPCHWANLM